MARTKATKPKSKAKNKGGRPQFEATDERRNTVRAMVAAGIKQEVIAACMGITDRTLRTRFRQEIDFGTEMMNTEVVQSLFKHATGEGQGAVTAAIFWLKARAGWKEANKLELTGENGGPVEISAVDELIRRIAGIASRTGEDEAPTTTH